MSEKRDPNTELGCGCGFMWCQFIDANIDELVNFCPMCGEKV